MTTERFLASAQYNDYKGTSAADRADDNGASAWLEANGHKQPDEFLLGSSNGVRLDCFCQGEK